ncbi:MAG: hypothetical protein JNL32_07655 [Candidatus Kapabacteria bacterium]|nr:hypothetical protein [Candidatus Kapabacteria bacterium]
MAVAINCSHDTVIACDADLLKTATIQLTGAEVTVLQETLKAVLENYRILPLTLQMHEDIQPAVEALESAFEKLNTVTLEGE